MNVDDTTYQTTGWATDQVSDWATSLATHQGTNQTTGWAISQATEESIDDLSSYLCTNINSQTTESNIKR